MVARRALRVHVRDDPTVVSFSATAGRSRAISCGEPHFLLSRTGGLGNRGGLFYRNVLRNQILEDARLARRSEGLYRRSDWHRILRAGHDHRSHLCQGGLGRVLELGSQAGFHIHVAAPVQLLFCAAWQPEFRPFQGHAFRRVFYFVDFCGALFRVSHASHESVFASHAIRIESSNPYDTTDKFRQPFAAFLLAGEHVLSGEPPQGCTGESVLGWTETMLH